MRSFRGHRSRLCRPFGPGWALVGDAGSWVDPLSTMGSPMRCATPSCSPTPWSWGPPRIGATMTALAGYQVQRDRMAVPMHALVDRLASHAWGPSEARGLLRGLSSLMADEVETMRGFDPAPARTG